MYEACSMCYVISKTDPTAEIECKNYTRTHSWYICPIFAWVDICVRVGECTLSLPLDVAMGGGTV